MIKNVYWSSCRVLVILFQFLMKLEFSRHILEKYSNIKFQENPSSGSRVVPCGQMDGRTDKTKLIVTFRNVANAPKMQHGIYIQTPIMHIKITQFLYSPCGYLEVEAPRFQDKSEHKGGKVVSPSPQEISLVLFCVRG